MAATLAFQLVDAFAERPYRGNPAGVVLEADGLTDAQMQRIAAEVGASETAFISRLNDLHRPTRLRWFTPTVEVGFCGHATLAAAHALQQAGYLKGLLARPDPALVFDSAAGELRLVPEVLPEPDGATLWWLAMPAPGLKPDNTNPIRTCELLGMHIDDLDPSLPTMRTRDEDMICFVKSWQTLNSLQPRFGELAAWCQRCQIRGICVATTETLSESVDVASRFFAPAVGVNEDPVTGSVHGPLATLLVVNELVGRALGRAGLMCQQGRPGDRGGLVRALVESTDAGHRPKIGGLCHTTIEGRISLPPVQ